MEAPHGQQPSFPPQYFQSTPGPPQPQWQAAQRLPGRSGWQDPRLQPYAQPATLSTPSSYIPNTYGRMPAIGQAATHYGTPSYDTSDWGVKHNQSFPQQQYGQPNGYHHGEHHVSKPPLPPRPLSSTGQSSYPNGPPQPSSPTPWQERPGNYGSLHTTSSEHTTPLHRVQEQYHYQPQQQQQHHETIPPPPPPRPPEYQSQFHYDRQSWPHPQYSHHPSSHHYEPESQTTFHQGRTQHQETQQKQEYEREHPQEHQQQHGPSRAQPSRGPWQRLQHEEGRPPVSPEESSHSRYSSTEAPVSPQSTALPIMEIQAEAIVDDPAALPSHAAEFQASQTNVSALGLRGPSAWEHFDSHSDQVKDTISGQMYLPDVLVNTEPRAELPTHTTPATSNRTSYQDSRPATSRGKEEPQIASSPQGLHKAPEISDTQSLPLHDSYDCREPRDPTVVPSRDASVSPELGIDGLQRTGTIDGVIQAWNNPLRGGLSQVSGYNSPQRRRSRQSSVSTQTRFPSREAEHNMDSAQSSARHKPLAPKFAGVDFYPDLDPEYQASLSRYVTMLRKESEAPTDEDKFRVFEVFVQKEMRLRSVLYGVGLSEPEGKKGLAMDPVGRSTTPVGTVAEDELIGHHAQNGTRMELPSGTPTHTLSTECLQTPPQARSTSLTLQAEPKSDEVPHVCLSHDQNEAEYSPGGRPKMSKTSFLQIKRRGTVPSLTEIDAASAQIAQETSSPADNAPIPVSDYATAAPNAPSSNAPIPTNPSDLPPTAGTGPLLLPSALLPPLVFEPPRPIYAPFRYNEGPRGGSEKLEITKPAYEAYSDLRHQITESGRVMGTTPANTGQTRQETLSSPSSCARREHEKIFLGLIREKSRAYRDGRPVIEGIAKQKLMPSAATQPKHDPKAEAVSAVSMLIPRTLPADRTPSNTLGEITGAINSILDEFGFIHETVVRWDRDNREVRQRQEQQRRMREENSQSHIDMLFNSHEISYSDIGIMEAEFKLGEAEKKYAEDQQELESFTATVFETVTDRVNTEINQLSAQYVLAIDLLDFNSDAGIQYLNGGANQAQTWQAIEAALLIFNKLQIRYQKLAEANFERERRRKKLELSVLTTNGDVVGMKKLEQEFTTAERVQVLHEARDRDERANRLMDAFDRAAVRGLGNNQTFVDELISKLRHLDATVFRASDGLSSINPSPEMLRDLLTSIETVLDFLIIDSQKTLTISNTADILLNNADYDVSVAEARVANAEATTYQKLENEKRKEDQKLQDELIMRMDSVSKGPNDATSVIVRMTAQISDTPQHEERVRRALEAAKMRNASKIAEEEL